jgi:hypothetical protein
MLNLITGIKPIELWHGNVEDHHIRLQFGRQPKQGSSVICDTGNLELGLEKASAGFRQ